MGGSLPHLFFQHAEASGSRPFLHWQGQWHTYGGFLGKVMDTARTLARAGVAKGTPVGLALGNSPGFVRHVMAVQLIGGAALPMNPESTLPEMTYQMADARCGHLVAEPHQAELCEREMGPEVKVLQPVPEASQEGAEGDSDREAFREHLSRLESGDRALIIYTSGTTSKPKGVVHTHRSLAAGADAVIRAWRWTAEDCLLLALPLCHVHGLCVGLYGTLAAGGRLVLHEKFRAADAWQAFSGGHVTLFFGVPGIYIKLLRSGRLRKEALAGVRLFVSGSAPLPPEVFHRFRDITGRDILERYGMTETIMNLTNPVEGPRRPGTVGLPFPGVAFRIGEAEMLGRGRIQDVKPGEEGELLLKSPSLFEGYLNRPEETAKSFIDGWFRSGDLARLESDGYVRLLGRTSVDIIKTRGYKVSAVEIEQVLQEHPDVVEAAVVGIGDKEKGEAVAAAVKLAEDRPADERALRAFCESRLIYYKVPDRFLFMVHIPKTGPGKYKKTTIRKILEAV
jgi:malonyl-CoA/methylmalonyl-CoA synthetase